VFDDNTVKVFEGTYQDFLERVGWTDEEDTAVRSSGNSTHKSTGAKKKDLKRIKAELINARSRTLGPLQSKISETEEQIMLLEEQIEEDTQALVDASVKGDGEAIRKLSISLRASKEKIDILFDELEKLTDEFDAKTREFEERLGTIQLSDG
jgi:ATP-binding cassette subfamily F protein 3